MKLQSSIFILALGVGILFLTACSTGGGHHPYDSDAMAAEDMRQCRIWLPGPTQSAQTPPGWSIASEFSPTGRCVDLMHDVPPGGRLVTVRN